MAMAILTASTIKAVKTQYHLPEAHRRILLVQADEPAGEITRSMLLEVEEKRLTFVEMYGNEFGQ